MNAAARVRQTRTSALPILNITCIQPSIMVRYMKLNTVLERSIWSQVLCRSKPRSPCFTI